MGETIQKWEDASALIFIRDSFSVKEDKKIK